MYYLVYGFLWLISLLPLRVLYVLSDILTFVVYRMIGYRKEVVMNNLAIAFPEKTIEERKKIAKRFYRNFIDSFIETIKIISASERFISKRFTGNWEVANQFYETGRRVQMHLGHNFNWEWGNLAGKAALRFQFLGVYAPISNKVFDRIFRKIRSRSGTVLLRANNMQADMLPYRHQQYLLGLVADQNPGHMLRALWFDFFGKRAPFTAGPAKNAIANDCVVIFAFIHKPRRGRYVLELRVEEEFPQQTTTEDLTRRFVDYLEEVIRTYPDMWLWSHRRWKNEWRDDYTFVERKKA